MKMLIVNPERFSIQDITAFGKIADANVYLAVSVADARRLLGSLHMDVMVCNVQTPDEIQYFRGIMQSGTTTALLLGISGNMESLYESLLPGENLVQTGEEMLLHVMQIASASINQTLSKGYNKKTNKREER